MFLTAMWPFLECHNKQICCTTISKLLHTFHWCIYLNAIGVCTKNGAHCAFAHGSGDLRTPTYDLREMQAMEPGESPVDGPAVTEMSTSMEKERILNDDPKWNGEPCVFQIYWVHLYIGETSAIQLTANRYFNLARFRSGFHNQFW